MTAKEWRDKNPDLEGNVRDYTDVLHLVVLSNLEVLNANMIESNIKNYRQFEFITDMGAAYACADLVLSRAGAGTIFELLALKKAALLVPLEGETRGDQVENAVHFQEKGLCRVLRQDLLFTLPHAIDEAFADENLQKRLQESDFHRGNELILHEIRNVLT
jgi:UDP-N-acetylglucosamine--N-acetylmuramyl-(pentapeptide) pyrophosphoryl-undecaprenol N-acetylglucosamine transferase